MGFQAGSGRAAEAERTVVSAVEAASGFADEALINALGYELLAREKVGLAAAVLAQNAEAHPDSANVHDSLGEALRRAGRRDEAVLAYRRALELDPFLVSANRALFQLEEEKSKNPR